MYILTYNRADRNSLSAFMAVQDGWVRNRRRWLWRRSTVNWN